MGEKPAHRGQLSDNYSCCANTERALSGPHKPALSTPAARRPPGILPWALEGWGWGLPWAVLGDGHLEPKSLLQPRDHGASGSAWKMNTPSKANRATYGMGGLSLLLGPR